MSENPFALAVAERTEVAAIDETAFSKIVKVQSWLPSLKLISSKSALVGAPHRLTSGNWYLKRAQKYQDLGTSPVVVCCAMRLKAVEAIMTAEGESWVNYYDAESEAFKSVMSKAEIPGNMGAFFGPEYLVWVDGAGEGGGEWALLLCGNKSSRMVSGELNSAVKGMYPISLPTDVVTKGKKSWEVFTPERFNGALQYYPTKQDLDERVSKFKAEQEAKATVEPAAEAAREQ